MQKKNLFQGKYRVDSARMKNWNYNSSGSYFITICTKKMKHFFGEIINDKMVLNEIGRIVEANLLELPIKCPYLKIDVYQIMPNHLHAIIIQNKNLIKQINIIENFSEPLFEIIPEENNKIKNSSSEEKKPGGCTGIHNPMLNDNLSSALRKFTAKCSREIRKIFPDFDWHGRFHDHFIRNEAAYLKIRFYIENNPRNWRNDCYFSKGK